MNKYTARAGEIPALSKIVCRDVKPSRRDDVSLAQPLGVKDYMYACGLCIVMAMLCSWKVVLPTSELTGVWSHACGSSLACLWLLRVAYQELQPRLSLLALLQDSVFIPDTFPSASGLVAP